MKYLIILLFFINNPYYKSTLNNEVVDCEIISLFSFSIDTLNYDTLNFDYLAKSEYCYLLLNFKKSNNTDSSFKRIEIGGKYSFHLKFLPEPNRNINKEYTKNKFYFFVTNLKYGGLGLYFNKDSLYELDYYYKNKFQEDSMAFNYMPLNVKGNYIHDSLIIYQP
ncbi:MAG: hypothetical protein WC121_01910 [Candidatus Kapaibacterium sp.]